jgi:hypothetical protein
MEKCSKRHPLAYERGCPYIVTYACRLAQLMHHKKKRAFGGYRVIPAEHLSENYNDVDEDNEDDDQEDDDGEYDDYADEDGYSNETLSDAGTLQPNVLERSDDIEPTDNTGNIDTTGSATSCSLVASSSSSSLVDSTSSSSLIDAGCRREVQRMWNSFKRIRQRG